MLSVADFFKRNRIGKFADVQIAGERISFFYHGMIMVSMLLMKTLLLIISSILFFFLAGCASMKPAAFEQPRADGQPPQGEPWLNPVKFFGGRTRSTGVIENRGGRPTKRITTETQGKVKEGLLYIEQDLYPEGGKKNHRAFKLIQVDEHHVDATADDIDGTAHGLLYGNAFSWTFRRKIPGRKFLKHVRMSQNMYLMPGGETMIIRSVIRKYGFVLAQITEQFQKY